MKSVESFDFEAWPRREIFRFFSSGGNPFWSVTVPLDVTGLAEACRREGWSFYHALIHLCCRACSGVDALMTGVSDGRVVRYPMRDPSFTSLRPGGELFRIVTLPYREDTGEFCRAARAADSQQDFFIDYTSERDDLIFFSCLPWLHYTAHTMEHGADPLLSAPKMTWGRYAPEQGRLMLPFTLELNHAFADGIHATRFFEGLEALIGEL